MRDTFAPGRFASLDGTLGRSAGGHLTKVIDGREPIYLDRFLLAIALLRSGWRSLSSFFDRPDPIPAAPPPGYLWGFREARKTLDPLDYLDALDAWIDSVAVEDAGYAIEIDLGFITGLANENRAEAEALATAHLRGLLAKRSNVINPSTACSVSRLLGVLADLHRTAGLRTPALSLFDAGFRLEGKVQDLATRSFLYRTAAYLLSDLGELDESYRFAECALWIAIGTKDCDGLGQSMYVRAVIVDRLGDYENAGQLYESALAQLAAERIEFRGGVHLASAYAYLQADRDRDAALAFEQAWDLLADHGGLHAARLRNIGGELASRRGDLTTAESLFAESRQLWEEHGTAGDMVLGDLIYAKHLLRTQDVERARDCVRRASELANHMDGNPVGEAAVLQLRLELSRGVLTNEILVQTLRRLEQPWRFMTTRAS